MELLKTVVLCLLIMVTINGWYINKTHKNKIKELDEILRKLK